MTHLRKRNTVLLVSVVTCQQVLHVYLSYVYSKKEVTLYLLIGAEYKAVYCNS